MIGPCATVPEKQAKKGQTMEQALTVSGFGDRDTTCAIVGGVVSLYTGIDGIPPAWRQAREPLPDWPFID